MAGLLKTQVQLGDSSTATQNFTLTSAAADGTMKLARGNAGATTQDILTVDAAGKVTFPQGSGNLLYTSTVTPLPATATPVAQSHTVGVVPIEAILELTCLTAEHGFSIGDVVERPCEFNGSTSYSPITTWKNATQVGFTLTSGLPLGGLSRSTGAAVIFTAANWSYRFKLRTA